MNTAEAVTGMVCATSLALGWPALAIGRQALRDSWIRYSVTFATVPRGKRFDWPKAAEQKVPETPAGAPADAAPGASADPRGRPPLEVA